VVVVAGAVVVGGLVVVGGTLMVTPDTPVCGTLPGKVGELATSEAAWKVAPSGTPWITSKVKWIRQDAPGWPTGASVTGPPVGVKA
jgi:hypothetical protein